MVKLDTVELTSKIKEFCAAILNQPEYQELRQMVDVFVADNEAVKLYEQFTDKYQDLQEKAEHELQPAEIAEYEREEQALYRNDSIRRFLYAHQEFNKVHHLVSQYFVKSIELNRVPERKELDRDSSCGCGGTCGSTYPIN